MSFGSFLETMKRNKLGFCVEGFINVESGTASVATQIFDTSECDCFDSGLGVPEEECEVCFRGPGNFVSCSAGSGDGVYAILGIYPTRDPKKRLGAVAVFDWGYELANSARSRVEIDNSLGFESGEFKSMEGNGLAISSSELNSFEFAKPILHGSLIASGPVFFSDDMAHRNANYAIVDVQLDSKSLDVFIFGAEEDPYADSLNWERSEAEQEIVKNSMFESMGLTPSEPTYFPQILMVLDSETADLFDFSDQLPKTEWAPAGVHWMSRMGTSHVEPQHISTYWVNALLARAKFRLALMRDDDTDEDDSQDPIDQMMSWALLGELSGDSDATNLINEIELRDLASLPDYRAAVLELRGWDGVPSEDAEELERLSKDSDGSNSSSGLTKSSGKSGLGSGSNETQISGISGSNFCANCGMKFESQAANFCPSCGSKRL
jgi:hypothetical protein